ncbi:MAG: flagellar filament capping protein FliD [Nitrospirales bacterium]|nr:flagellar filament capping protein FliD [Nitrospira sp.]MDR4502375.1 flagellar filament capping protein FliD [Nitrospirales bacterium]
MNISFGGLGNGVDFGQIVDFLVKAERIPIDRLTEKKLASQKKLTDFGSVGTKLLSLQSTANSLRTRLSFDKTKVDVSTASTQNILSATSSSTATAGTHTVTVNQLATAHQVASKSTTTVASTTTDIVSGSSGTFSFTVAGGATQTVTLSSDATLDDLTNAINDLGAGVSASILNTGSESSPAYRLILTANDTGAANTIAITADDTTLDTVSSGVDTLQAAQDSEVVLGAAGQDQVTLQRSSNTLTDVITGVTLNLQGTDTNNPVTIAVTQDVEAVKEGITSLVDAYNDVVSFINERTVYNAETEERGIFVGETVVRTVLDKIRRALSDQVSGLSTVSSAGQIGFQTQPHDGTIEIDETDLDARLSDSFDEVRELFINNPVNGTTGIAERLVDAIDVLDDLEFGALALRQNSLSDEVNDFDEQINVLETRLVTFEEQQRIKFANLDGLLASLQSQLDSLNSLI